MKKSAGKNCSDIARTNNICEYRGNFKLAYASKR
jgi:hypothetical protein